MKISHIFEGDCWNSLALGCFSHSMLPSMPKGEIFGNMMDLVKCCH